MFKSLRKKDLEFHEDTVFDPHNKVYMRVLTAPLKNVRTSSISLFGLLSPLVIDLLPIEDKILIVLYSLSPKELDNRVKVANRYLTEIFPSMRVLQGHHLKSLFSAAKSINYKNEVFWAQNHILYALYDMSSSYQAVKEFSSFYLKRKRSNGDLKIRLHFWTPGALMRTRKKQKNNLFEESSKNVSFEEKLSHIKEFRNIEVLAMVAESYHPEFLEDSLEEAYQSVQNNFQSSLREVDSALRIRSHYPSKDSSNLPISHGLHVLANLLSQMTQGFPKSSPQAKQSKNSGLSAPISRHPVTSKNYLDANASQQSITNLAVILGTEKGNRVFIDPSATGTNRLALLNLVLQPFPLFNEPDLDSENPLSGPYPISGFSKCLSFSFKITKSNVRFLIWLVISESNLRLLLNGYEYVESFLGNWVDTLDLNSSINVGDLTSALTSHLNQEVSEVVISS